MKEHLTDYLNHQKENSEATAVLKKKSEFGEYYDDDNNIGDDSNETEPEYDNYQKQRHLLKYELHWSQTCKKTQFLHQQVWCQNYFTQKNE